MNSLLKHKGKYIYTAIFDLFWEYYPRKIRKKAAFIIWQRLNYAQKQQNIIASKNYAEAMEGKEEEYILMPTTFLNPKKCLWEDYMKPHKKEKTWLENRMEEEKS